MMSGETCELRKKKKENFELLMSVRVDVGLVYSDSPLKQKDKTDGIYTYT